MDLKHIGYVLMMLSLVQIAIGFVAKDQVNTLKLAQLPTSCHTGNDPSTCSVLKDSVDLHVVVLWVLSVGLFAFGVHLAFFAGKEGEAVEAEKKKMITTMKKMAAKTEGEEKFEILLKGLDEAEQKVMRAVREQDGIKQNTLYIRTDLSKTKLSFVLTDLEKRGLVRKMPEGKTNRIYLKQAV